MTQTPTAKKSVQLSGVVVAESSVSSIDPDAGVLMYRGYDIADIAEHSTYEDTAYLLLHGDLPDAPRARRSAASCPSGRCRRRSQHAVDESAAQATPMEMVRTVASMLSFGSEAAGRDRP